MIFSMLIFRKNIPAVIYLITIPLLLVDVYHSNMNLMKYLHLDSRIVALVSIAVLGIIRIFYKNRLKGVISALNTFFLIPLCFIPSVIFTIYDHFYWPNAAYSLFHVQTTQIFLIGIYASIIALFSMPGSWYLHHYKNTIFLGALAVFDAALVASLFPFDVFIKLSQEDHLIEYLQVGTLLAGAYFAYRFSKSLSGKGKTFHALIFAWSVFALIFVAGDEISWGQRLLNIETPAQIAINNAQQEITLHNLKSVNYLVAYGYLIIGLFGSTMWVIPELVSKLKHKALKYYISPWYCSIYFFFSFAYNYYILTHRYHNIGVWAESAELMLYSGIMFMMLSNYLSTRPNQHNN